jgi:hypothetical protein
MLWPGQTRSSNRGSRQPPEGPPTEEDRLIAYDGKKLRSAQGIELASGFSVQTGRWMGTEAVESGSNEIPAIQRLLARTDLTGRTAVMDALNTQEETARQGAKLQQAIDDPGKPAASRPRVPRRVAASTRSFALCLPLPPDVIMSPKAANS